MRCCPRRIGFSLKMSAMQTDFRIACSRSSTVFLASTFPFFVPTNTHKTKQNKSRIQSTKCRVQSLFARLRRPHRFDVNSLHWFATFLPVHRFFRHRQRRIRGLTAIRTAVSTVSTVSTGSGHSDGGFDLRSRGRVSFRGERDGNRGLVLLPFCTGQSQSRRQSRRVRRKRRGRRRRRRRGRIAQLGGSWGVGNLAVLGGLRDDADGKALGMAARAARAARAATWNHRVHRVLATAAGAGAEREDDGEEGLHEVLQEKQANAQPEVQLGLRLDVGSVDFLVGSRIEVVDHRVVRHCNSLPASKPTETERRRNAQTDPVVLSIVEYCYAAHERIAQQNVLHVTRQKTRLPRRPSSTRRDTSTKTSPA